MSGSTPFGEFAAGGGPFVSICREARQHFTGCNFLNPRPSMDLMRPGKQQTFIAGALCRAPCAPQLFTFAVALPYCQADLMRLARARFPFPAILACNWMPVFGRCRHTSLQPTALANVLEQQSFWLALRML